MTDAAPSRQLRDTGSETEDTVEVVSRLAMHSTIAASESSCHSTCAESQ